MPRSRSTTPRTAFAPSNTLTAMPPHTPSKSTQTSPNALASPEPPKSKSAREQAPHAHHRESSPSSRSRVNHSPVGYSHRSSRSITIDEWDGSTTSAGSMPGSPGGSSSSFMEVDAADLDTPSPPAKRLRSAPLSPAAHAGGDTLDSADSAPPAVSEHSVGTHLSGQCTCAGSNDRLSSAVEALTKLLLAQSQARQENAGDLPATSSASTLERLEHSVTVLTETTNTRQNPQPSSQSDESGPSTKHNDKYLHSLDHRLAELSSIAPHTALIPTIVDDVNAVRAKADALDSFLAVRTGTMMQKMNDNEAALIRLQSQVSDLAAIAPSVNLAIPEINKNVNTLRARADAQEATLVVRTDVMVDKLKEMDLGVQLVTGKTQSIEKRMTSLENTMWRIETCLSTLVDRLDTASAVSSGDKDGDTEMRSNSPLPPGSSRAATGPFTAPRPPASRQVQVVPEQWDEVTSVQLATFGMTEHVAAMEQKINFLCTWTEDNTIHAPLAVLAADVEDIRLMLSSQGLYVPHRPMPLPSAPVLIPAQPRAQTTSSPSYTSPSNSNPVTNTTGNPPPNPYGIVDHAAATTRQQMKATTGRTDRIREANAESKGIPKDPGAEHSAYSLSRPPLSSRDDDPWTSLQNHLQMESRMRDEPVAGPSVPRGADALGNSDEKNGAVFFWWD